MTTIFMIDLCAMIHKLNLAWLQSMVKQMYNCVQTGTYVLHVDICTAHVQHKINRWLNCTYVHSVFNICPNYTTNEHMCSTCSTCVQFWTKLIICPTQVQHMINHTQNCTHVHSMFNLCSICKTNEHMCNTCSTCDQS